VTRERGGRGTSDPAGDRGRGSQGGTQGDGDGGIDSEPTVRRDGGDRRGDGDQNDGRGSDDCLEDEKRVQVLFVDADCEAARHAAGELSERGSFDVLGAESVAAAVDHATHDDGIDCVVAAHGERVDAIELIDRLERLEPAPPVVVFPHGGDEGLAARAGNAGTEGYVPRTGSGTYDRLASRVRRAARTARHRRHEAKRTLVIDVGREISQAAIRADSREELESTICERLAGSGPYLAAVIGSVNPETEETVPRADSAGDGVDLEQLVEDATGRLQILAVRTGRIHVRELDGNRGTRRAAAIPITHGDHLYGVLTVYAHPEATFEQAELAVLRDLCETTGHAIDGIERQRALQRREAELTEQNERLEAFASVVSHDLRNPLDVTEGYVELARENDDPTLLDEALAGIERARTIVEDLLVLARADRGIRETESVELEAVARDAWRHVDTGGAELRVEGEGTVTADESQLQRLLENLFRNCIEHGGEGRANPVTVSVGTRASVLFVADDGPGIDPDERETVFDPGFTTAQDGTGLGLAIVSRIADAHGWEVAVSAGPDGGARIDVETDPDH